MTTSSQTSDGHVYELPAPEPPPTVATGVVLWIRSNLFKSVFDSIVTIVAALVIVSAIVGLLGWIISDANWFVITKNLRSFMVGRFPAEAIWRVNVFALLLAFTVGFTIAVFSRIKRSLLITLLVILALTFIIPPLVARFLPQASAYLAVGDAPIASGSVTETPQTQVGFIGMAGEEITIRTADQLSSDEALSQVAGFVDRASNAVVNASANRLAAEQEQADVQNELTNDLLTDSQRQKLTDELNGLQIPPSVSDTFHVNAGAASIKILDGQSLEALADGVVQTGSAPFTFTLPRDGWYVLDKQAQGDGVVLLQTTGIYPILVSNFSATDVRYLRMSDNFLTTEMRPQINGKLRWERQSRSSAR